MRGKIRRWLNQVGQALTAMTHSKGVAGWARVERDAGGGFWKLRYNKIVAIRRPSIVCGDPGCPFLAPQGRTYCREHPRRHVAMRLYPALRRQQLYRSPGTHSRGAAAAGRSGPAVVLHPQGEVGFPA
jgi:hypothetical protein